MRINNNISAMNTSRQLGNVSGRLSRSMEKLSSGLRIARAADDAAGLAVSEKLRGQIRGVNAAVRAQQDSVSGLQVAEGALNEVSSMLIRAKELAIQRSGTSDSDAISAIDAELSQVFIEVDNIETNTEYNGNKLFDGSGSFSIYTDINGTTNTLIIDSLHLVATETPTVATDKTDGLFRVLSNDSVELFNDLGDADVTNILGTSTGNDGLVYSDLALDASDGAPESALGDLIFNADDYISEADANTASAGSYAIGLKSALDSAINKVATLRGQVGSYQNRFEASIRNFEGTAENLQAAESRIRDVDMAKEMVGFTKDTIIQQAAQAMLVQANQLPQSIVGLLQ
jgi:flagellin